MFLWKNTKTLDGLIDDIPQTISKEKAQLALMGSKVIGLDEFPNLKGIFRVGVSTTNVPFEEAKNRSIAVCFPSEKTKNYIYIETADFTCGIIFKTHYSHLGTVDPWVKYDRISLSKKKLLIIGEGRIGSIVKEKMSAFMKVFSFDPIKYPDIKIETLLSVADFVSIHIPDTKENICFIDKEKLRLMKNNAILINTARGRIIDENALYDELNNKRLFATFDVFWKEPYKGKLKKFYPERFMMTPHVASTCNEFLTSSVQDLRIFIKYLENIR